MTKLKGNCDVTDVILNGEDKPAAAAAVKRETRCTRCAPAVVQSR